MPLLIIKRSQFESLQILKSFIKNIVILKPMTNSDNLTYLTLPSELNPPFEFLNIFVIKRVSSDLNNSNILGDLSLTWFL